MAVDHTSADFQAAADRNRAFGKGPTAVSSPNPNATGSDLYVKPREDAQAPPQSDNKSIMISPDERRRHNP